MASVIRVNDVFVLDDIMRILQLYALYMSKFEYYPVVLYELLVFDENVIYVLTLDL